MAQELTLDQQKAIAMASARQRAAAAQGGDGSQPSLIDRIVASPAGRAVHDLVVDPIANVAKLGARAIDIAPMIMGLPPASLMPTKLPSLPAVVDTVAAAPEKGYQASLAANRNTPGYAAARARADQITPGSGFTDQVTAPLNPALAGLSGGLLGGSWDDANAAADSQADAQSAYAKEHPIKAFAGGLLGGMLAGPSGAADSVPAYAGDSGLLTRLGKGAVPEVLPPNPTAPVSVPSISDLRAAARAAYRDVDNSGVKVSSDAMNSMADAVQDRFGDRLDETLHPDAMAAYKRITQFATDGSKGTVPATFPELDNLRRVVADATYGVKDSDSALAGQMLDHLDDFVSGLGPEHLDTTALDDARSVLTSVTGQKGAVSRQIRTIEQNKPGALAARGAAGAQTRQTYMDLQDRLPQLEQARQDAASAFNTEGDQIATGAQDAVSSLNNARSLWARSAKAQTIQKVIDKAGISGSGYSSSGYENALRTGFRNLAKNDAAMARFNPDEQAAIRQVATGGSALSATNLLRQVGKLSPQGAIPLIMELGGAAYGGPPVLAVPAAGLAARMGATALQKAAAKRALDLALMGRDAAPVTRQGILAIPQLPGADGMPYGILGSQLLAGQPVQSQ